MALIGVDVGGTFTDLCLYDDEKEAVAVVGATELWSPRPRRQALVP